MKQQITDKQFDKLSEEAKDKLRAKIWDCGNITIGHMIEFLDEHHYFNSFYKTIQPDTGQLKMLTWNENKELCDALWEAVKEVLNAK